MDGRDKYLTKIRTRAVVGIKFLKTEPSESTGKMVKGNTGLSDITWSM